MKIMNPEELAFANWYDNHETSDETINQFRDLKAAWLEAWRLATNEAYNNRQPGASLEAD